MTKNKGFLLTLVAVKKLPTNTSPVIKMTYYTLDRTLHSVSNTPYHMPPPIGHYDSLELRRYFDLEWISGKSRFKTCTGSLILIKPRYHVTEDQGNGAFAPTLWLN
jgi:hypothetical protein